MRAPSTSMNATAVRQAVASALPRLSIVIAVSAVPWTMNAGQVISPTRSVMSSRSNKVVEGSANASFGLAFHFAVHFGFIVGISR